MHGTAQSSAAAKRRPRLLYLASSFPYGQNDTFFGPEVRELVRQGVDVLAVPIRPRGPLTTPDAETLTLRKPLIDREVLSAAFAQLALAPRETLRAFLLLFRSPRPNVLLRNLAAFPKALWLARLARSRRVDHIHAHWAGPPSTVALVAARLSDVPWSFTAHATEILARNLLREKSGSAVFVRFVAEAMMERARTAEPGIDESRWVLLRLGIDVPQDAGPHAPNDPPVLLLTASFVPGKGHDITLQAVKRLVEEGQNLELWLAGAGPLEEDVRSTARDLELDGVVRLHGYVPNAQLLDWLASGGVDVVVLASHAEGLPMSLIEALAHGVPAVAADVGGVAELLGDGCGLLVPPSDPEALAAALTQLLTSPQLAAEYARAGRRRIEDQFAVPRVVQQLRARLGFADEV